MFMILNALTHHWGPCNEHISTGCCSEKKLDKIMMRNLTSDLSRDKKGENVQKTSFEKLNSSVF